MEENKDFKDKNDLEIVFFQSGEGGKEDLLF